jgi:hypothetical protein
MARAADDDDTRLDVLRVILRRRVLVATWPHSPESVRTLTNSSGEQAMPLFTGFDVLLEAAHRFGWTSPDGSVSHRELAAADALRGAVANNVHFIVLDISTECAVEFGREEVDEALLAPLSARPESAPPAQKRASRRPHDLSAPGVKTQALNLSAVIVEEAVVPRGRAARPDPRAEPAQAKQQLGVVTVARVPQSVLQARQAAAAQAQALQEAAAAAAAADPQTGERALAERGDPTIEDRLPPVDFTDAPAVADAPAHPLLDAALPALDALPPLEVAAAAPAFDLPPLGSIPPLPALDAVAPLPEASAEPADILSAAFAAPSDEPRARPAALAAAAMVKQAAKLAGDGATREAAREVASMLTDMAAQGSVEGESGGEPGVMGTAGAKAIVAMLGASAEQEAKKKKRRGNKASSAGTVAAAAEPAAAAAAGAEPAKDRESGIEPRGLRPPEAPLADALLSQIADVMRKYPEVEWACEVSDGTAVPVIGMRVAPTFLTRVPEIRAAVLKTSGAHGVELSLLLLEDPQQMREARAQGTLFFPWRKKAAAKR